MSTYTVHPMKLAQINRSTFITFNQQYRIMHTPFNGGKSAWIVSRVTEGGYWSAFAQAQTYDDAVAKLRELAS